MEIEGIDNPWLRIDLQIADNKVIGTEIRGSWRDERQIEHVTSECRITPKCRSNVGITSCNGDVAVAERSSVVERNRAFLSLTTVGLRDMPESVPDCFAKPDRRSGASVLATIWPPLRKVASTPVGWLICRTVRSMETPLKTYPNNVPS